MVYVVLGWDVGLDWGLWGYGVDGVDGEVGLERRLHYDADVGRPSFERQKETDTGHDDSSV